MFKELEKIMNIELKETRRLMSHQIENISKEIESIKRDQKEILELRSIRTDIKKKLLEFNTRLEQAEERTNELKTD